ncbi:MAG: glycoside hydrolase family 92 protein [Terrimonas sp.]|nr:glycoside hydrolase family 92 protein [Terrimonas sp.]
MKKSAYLFCFVFLHLAVRSQQDFTKYALPIVGTQNEYQFSNGNLYPCIALPFAMNHWTPQTAVNGERWQYSYNANQITGLKETHQPSPWVGDYGVLSLLPTVGERKFLEKDRQSWFSHKAEVAAPNYYKVYLADYNVTAEMTPTERACMMQFTFPVTDQANVVIDAFDQGSHVEIIPGENKVIGYTSQKSGGKKLLPENFRNYFVIIFNKPFTGFSTWKDSSFVGEDKNVTGNRTGVVLTFSTTNGEKVLAKIASSFISPEQAELNLTREIGNSSFAQIKAKGTAKWNEYLSRFNIKDDKAGDLDNIRMFYSALYRMLLYPREFFEYDSNRAIVHYSPYNGNILPGRMYTDNGFWDTFRAEHPFFTLFFPELSAHILEGLANTYKESGWLPEWASPGHIKVMIGSNSASVIAAAYLNGVEDVDINTLWDALYKNAYHVHPVLSSVGRAGVDAYNELGYVPNDVVNESAARTLEYAYDDYCLYKLAQRLKKEDQVIATFRERAFNYKNLFYEKYKLMAGRDSKGHFPPDFNPFAWGGDFTEGNSWQYTWSVLHDPYGLEQLMGGQKQFVAMLDSVFSLPPVFDYAHYGKVIHEMREMQTMDFGQYAHGNQPIQHMIYLYDWAGQPWKTQYWSRQVMKRLYHPTADGYCGDEDNGQTSAWYVFSALGFYPVCPVTGELAIGSPLFQNLEIKLSNGKKLELKADENSDKNVYLDGITVNGREYHKNYFTLQQIQGGGTIRYKMSSEPNQKRGVDIQDMPFSLSRQK